MTAFTLERSDLPLQFLGQLPPQIKVNEPFSWEPEIINAVGSTQVAVIVGSPPAWMIPDPSTGAISGTPTVLEAITGVVLEVVDSRGRRATLQISTTVVLEPEDVTVRPKVDTGPVFPAYSSTIYVDHDAAVNGNGTEQSPYNIWRGSSTTHTDVVPGTRVLHRGRFVTWAAGDGNRLLLRRGGTSAAPVLHVGNDPAWGQCIIDGAADIATTACASQAEARGAVDWQNLVHGTLTEHLDPQDFRHTLYAGPDREAMRCSVFPDHSDLDWLNYELFLTFDSWLDLFWHPGVNEQAPTFVSGTSRGRFRLSPVAGDSPERAAQRAALASMLTPDQFPIIVQRVRPNVWRTCLAYRGDADGTANPVGEWLLFDATPYDAYVGDEDNYYDPARFALNRFAVCNLSQMVNRPGRFAFRPEPADPWVVAWPPAPGVTLARSRGHEGPQFYADHVWVHGFKSGGLAPSATTNAGRGSVFVTTTARSGIRIQYCTFGVHMGLDSRASPVLNLGGFQTDMVIRRNSFSATAMCRAIQLGSGFGCVIERNLMDGVGGSNIGIIGIHVANMSIQDNFLRNTLDIHGNSITLYANFYGLRVTGNVAVNTNRGLTMEEGYKVKDIYLEDTYGQAYAYIADNILISEATREGSQYGARIQGRAKNVILEGNTFGGENGFSFSTSEQNSDLVANNNVILGLTYSDPQNRLVAGVGNAIYDHLTEPGATLLANALATPVPADVGAA